MDIAVHEDAIYAALRQSHSCGELKRRLPPGEWSRLAEQLPLSEEDDPEDRSKWDDDAPLVLDRLPGYAEGEYPTVRSEWLGDACDFPNALINAHNHVLLASAYRAVHWQIFAACADTVAATLREWGYYVERTDFLEFC